MPSYLVWLRGGVETNTLRFSSSEATVTLEYIAYIYSLPIDAPIVTRRRFPSSKVQEVRQEELGRVLQPGPDVNGINIKFTWSEDNFIASKNKRKITEDEEIYHISHDEFIMASMMKSLGTMSSSTVNIWHRFLMICCLP